MSNPDAFYLWPQLTVGPMFVGKNTGLGGTGTVTRWNADIRRYSQHLENSSSINDDRYQIGFNPRALVDRLLPASGIIVKIQDIVRAQFQGVTSAQVPKTMFIVTSQTSSTLSLFDKGGIGWNARYVAGGGIQPTWQTQYANIGRTAIRTVDSGKSCDVPRLLAIHFDGKAQVIRWYCDDVLVDTFAPPIGEVGGQDNIAPSPSRESIHWVCSGGLGGPGPGASFDYKMLPGPLMTVQYPDVQ